MARHWGGGPPRSVCAGSPSRGCARCFGARRSPSAFARAPRRRCATPAAPLRPGAGL